MKSFLPAGGCCLVLCLIQAQGCVTGDRQALSKLLGLWRCREKLPCPYLPLGPAAVPSASCRTLLPPLPTLSATIPWAQVVPRPLLLGLSLTVCVPSPFPHFSQTDPHSVLARPHNLVLLSTLASAVPGTLLPEFHPSIHPGPIHTPVHSPSIYACMDPASQPASQPPLLHSFIHPTIPLSTLHTSNNQH